MSDRGSIGLVQPLDLQRSSRPKEEPKPKLGGFPWDCYDNQCTTQDECILFGCRKGNGDPPKDAA